MKTTYEIINIHVSKMAGLKFTVHEDDKKIVDTMDTHGRTI